MEAVCNEVSTKKLKSRTTRLHQNLSSLLSIRNRPLLTHVPPESARLTWLWVEGQLRWAAHQTPFGTGQTATASQLTGKPTRHRIILKTVAAVVLVPSMTGMPSGKEHASATLGASITGHTACPRLQQVCLAHGAVLCS
jgi:hypothetical protein